MGDAQGEASGGAITAEAETDGTPEQERKLFLGGLSWDTTEDSLRLHYAKHGTVADLVVMKDKMTGRSRGFGFVTYATKAAALEAVRHPATIDGKRVEAKVAQSREAMGGGGAKRRPKKIFVGGLDPDTTEGEVRECFAQFGSVEELLIMKDGATSLPRGFGFVTFCDEAAVDACLKAGQHKLHGRDVQVKLAVPKEAIGPRGGGGAYGRYPAPSHPPSHPPAGYDRGYSRGGYDGYSRGGYGGGYSRGAYDPVAGFPPPSRQQGHAQPPHRLQGHGPPLHRLQGHGYDGGYGVRYDGGAGYSPYVGGDGGYDPPYNAGHPSSGYGMQGRLSHGNRYAPY